MFETLKNFACTDRLLRRMPVVYQNTRRQLQRFENANAGDKASIQQNRIAKTLRRARLLPGYANTLTSDRLEDWPILTKADIQGREQQFADTTIYPTPQAESGGTTGMPLRLKRSIPSISFEQAIVDILTEKIGIDARKARIAMLKADNLSPALTGNGQYWYNIGAKKRVYSSHHICADTVDTYRHSLINFAPDILFCYPSSVETLLRHLGDNHGLKIPLVFTSSEILYPATCELIRDQLQCDNIDYYGHAERLVSAYNINGGQYLRTAVQKSSTVAAA
jgi:phenylacetate-CoA ligase